MYSWTNKGCYCVTKAGIQTPTTETDLKGKEKGLEKFRKLFILSQKLYWMCLLYFVSIVLEYY